MIAALRRYSADGRHHGSRSRSHTQAHRGVGAAPHRRRRGERLTRCAQAGPAGVAEGIERLDREWDTGRSIEAEAALTGLTGLALSALAGRRFLALPAFVGAAVFVRARTGWYPLLPLMRRLGIRSAREIERERYALKALRGDFDRVPRHGQAGPSERARAALDAVDA